METRKQKGAEDTVKKPLANRRALKTEPPKEPCDGFFRKVQELFGSPDEQEKKVNPRRQSKRKSAKDAGDDGDLENQPRNLESLKTMKICAEQGYQPYDLSNNPFAAALTPLSEPNAQLSGSSSISPCYDSLHEQPFVMRSPHTKNWPGLENVEFQTPKTPSSTHGKTHIAVNSSSVPQFPTPSFLNRISPTNQEGGESVGTEVFEASTSNRWNPTNFAKKWMYDTAAGVPLAREKIEENLQKLSKSPKTVDYMDFLSIASKFHVSDPAMEDLALGCAFQSALIGKSTAKLSPIETSVEEPDGLVEEGHGFSLTEAEKYEDIIVLPSGRSFRMSETLDPYAVSDWTSTNFDTDGKSLLRHSLTAVSSRDPFFVAFTATKRSSKHYFPVGRDFYESVAKYIIRGFQQEPGDQLKTKVFRMIRESLINLLDRKRSAFNSDPNNDSVKLAIFLKNELIRCGGKLRVEPLWNQADPSLNGTIAKKT